MTLELIGAAVLSVLALTAVGVLVLHRPAPPVNPAPTPTRFTNIRVLHDDAEVREAARRACEREQLIARAAEQRAAHFGALTRSPGT